MGLSSSRNRSLNQEWSSIPLCSLPCRSSRCNRAAKHSPLEGGKNCTNLPLIAHLKAHRRSEMKPKVVTVPAKEQRPVLLVDRHGKPLIVAEMKKDMGFRP